MPRRHYRASQYEHRRSECYLFSYAALLKRIDTVMCMSRKPQLTLKELKFLHDEMIKEGGEHTEYLLSQLLSMNDKLTSEQILALKAEVKARSKPHKWTTQDMLLHKGLWADVSEREYRANRDKYRLVYPNPISVRKGLIEKVRQEHKELKKISDSRIIMRLMRGELKFPAGFDEHSITIMPGKDATDEEWDQAIKWMFRDELKKAGK